MNSDPWNVYMLIELSHSTVMRSGLLLPVLRVSSRPLFTSCFLQAVNPSVAPASSTSDAEPKPFSKMPGLKGLPLLGCVPLVMRGFKSQKTGDEHFLHQLHSQLGPIYRLRSLGNSWQVVTSSPEAAEAILRSEGKYPSRGLEYEKNMMWISKKLDTPPPMFFSNGEVWKKTRSSAAKQVVPRRVGNFVGPLCIIAEELLSHLEDIQNESGVVSDINHELMKWAFQGVSYFVYGEKINVYSEADPLQKEFMEAGLDYIQSLVGIGLALPLYRIYPTKSFRHFARIMKRMQRAGKGLLERRYEEMKDAISLGVVDEAKAVGLLDQWLIEGKFTEEEALSNSYDMLSAGIDTTSNTATFLLYEIAKQPELQDRLVQEISSVVGDKEHPSWEDLQKMTLVRNCVKETMRMYSPTAVLPRTLSESTVLLGYNVPAGTDALISMVTMGRDEQVFENARQFIPDRWSSDGSAKFIHPFSSLSFGFGPRACYGRRLAELELYILLAKMLPKYQLSTSLEAADLKLKQAGVLRPAVPLPMNVTSRVKL